MTTPEFWQLLDASTAAATGNQSAQADYLSEQLAALEPEQIIEFECQLRQHLREADDFKIMAALKIMDGFVSDDSYLYFRCWLVGQGEAVFRQALQDADTLAQVAQEPYQEFENLLYVATEAFGRRTGQPKEDETFPRAVASSRGLSYDFGAETTGEDWREEQLPKLLPRLWKKFN
ncbi:DUF4240 domain-containing protein [Hymenobacter chitinivorans]|uniref:Uncharacterized protein DUF4240 n=1 Tax=Hymenobacter chitinivorans DSM 11115 TaxID=1121954 RepID=A0A2M9B5V7_9BACT|nr:DUF4240 domain-containing protein [Hymenobacter chitinivorans]PJJ53336.1 uncharacterized protein DUF4240 [Hymenobacter chitinivorans DSM 11115]